MADRRRGIALRAQFKNASLLAALWCVGIFVLAAAGLQSAAPIEQLFLDPAFLSGQPWYTGLLSNLGILAWAVAATAAGAGAWVASQVDRSSAALFLLSGALITVVLLADDLFQLHAGALPRGGMDARAAAAIIVMPAVVWMLTNRAEIARTRWLLLAAALAGFCASLLVDSVATGGASSRRLFIEDGAKLLGILAWAQYFVVTAIDITRSGLRDAQGIADRAWTVDSVGFRRAEASEYSQPRDPALDAKR